MFSIQDTLLFPLNMYFNTGGIMTTFNNLITSPADYFWFEMTKVALYAFNKRQYEKILDIGFDKGASTYWMGQCNSAEVILALDKHNSNSQKLQSQFSCQIKGKKLVVFNGSIEDLPFKNKSIDAIFCRSVLQYTDYKKSLQEIQRVLSPKGSAFIIANLANNPIISLYRIIRKDHTAKDNKYITYDELQKMKKDNRIKHHREQHLITPLIYPIIRSNLLSPIVKRFIIKVTTKLEVVFLSCLPFLKRFCWYSLIEINNENKSIPE